MIDDLIVVSKRRLRPPFFWKVSVEIFDIKLSH